MSHSTRASLPLSTLLLAGALFAAVPATAATMGIQDGSVTIGTLDSSVDQYGDQAGTFTLNPAYRNLMSDANGDQFRFFQVIYYDDEPVTYQGNLITPPSAPAHSGTVVDVPAGGWDYEQPQGDDYSPFYESNTENNPSTGQPYAFPTLSYPDLHSPDGVNPGVSTTQDSPGLDNPDDQTLFETFLVYVDPTLATNHEFDLLGGYSWGVATDSSDNEYGIDSTNIPFTSINAAKLQELQSALDRSGYTGSNAWTVEAVSSFAPLQSVPEPSSIAMFAVAAFGFGLRRFVR